MPAIPDALMFREVEADGSVWDVLRIPASRIPDCEARGWIVLISAPDVRASDIAETYAADVARFNRPRRG